MDRFTVQRAAAPKDAAALCNSLIQMFRIILNQINKYQRG